MSAPYRITQPVESRAGALATTSPQGGFQAWLQNYLERLMKLIPSEVIALYLVGSGLIPPDNAVVLTVWAVFCLIAVAVVRAFGTSDAPRNLPLDWIHVAISCGSFIVWLYQLPNSPFAAWGLYVPYIGSLLLLAYTFIVPYVWKGETSGSPVVVPP